MLVFALLPVTIAIIIFSASQSMRAMEAEKKVLELELKVAQLKTCLTQYYTGYVRLLNAKQLSSSLNSSSGWRGILGFDSSEKVTLTRLNERYKKLALVFHPDSGGSTSVMASLNNAKSQAEMEIKK